MEILVIIAFVVILGIYLSARSRRKKREALFAKYGDATVVERIMNHEFWQGQTDEQLTDSLGLPLDLDEKVFKTKTKHIWKYRQMGKNRYGLRVTLENGVVVGWELK